jgi:hypothetical protein
MKTNGRTKSLDRPVEQLKKEQEIFDKGYDAVRTMATEMVANGANLADILFHANQLWHEFKFDAIGVPGVIQSGMYMDRYDREFTEAVLGEDERYVRGIDEVRAAMYAAAYSRGAAEKPAAG